MNLKESGRILLQRNLITFCVLSLWQKLIDYFINFCSTVKGKLKVVSGAHLFTTPLRRMGE
jgi:hypothetical protein